jgi:transposase
VAIAWQTEDTAEALREQYRKEQDGEVRTRLHGMWLLCSGRPLAEVAQTIGVHSRTVQRWVGWYRHGGLTEVRTRRGGGHGQPSFLTEEQEAAVAAQAAQGAFRTAAEARQWVAEQFGVHYRPAGIYGLLYRVECRPKVPRPVHSKADPQAQEAWKKGAARRR